MCSLSNFFRASRKLSTFPIMTFAAFQLLSFGILPLGAVRIITAAVTFTTAGGGDPKDFSSVRLFWKETVELLSVTPTRGRWHHLGTFFPPRGHPPC